MRWNPTEKIEYLDGKQKLGIIIDWNKVRKEYKKLKIPKETHYPLKADISSCGYIIDLSDRSRGKTTNKLILGLLLYKMYGIELQYVRQRKTDIAPKTMNDLYKTVIDYKYIEKIFDNKFNDIFYHGKRWYLTLRDDNGEVVEKCEPHCTFCIGLDDSDSLKSVYNAPRGDMIFHDEFITSTYGYSDFIRFSDICKTIIRDRISPIIFMSANTINKNSPWFAELCIEKEIEPMEQGEDKIIVSDEGTHIFLEILDENISKDRANVNKRFWGFKNPKLSSITGKGTWATEAYPHIPTYRDDEEPPEVLQDILFIRHNSKYVMLRLVDDKERGLCVFVFPATRTYHDSIILTVDDITTRNELFGLAKETFCVAYWRLFLQNKFYYSRNSEGAFLKSYMSLVRTLSNSR